MLERTALHTTEQAAAVLDGGLFDLLDGGAA